MAGSSEVRIPGLREVCNEPMLVLDFGTGQNYTICPERGEKVAVTGCVSRAVVSFGGQSERRYGTRFR